MISTKLMLIVGEPGSRIDFVGGWLGTLDNFVDSNWTICADTGQSNGSMSAMTKTMDYSDESIDVALSQFQLTLSHTASLWSCGTCHSFRTNQFEPHYSQELVNVAVIDTSNVLRSKIRWEFIVKTFLNKNYSNKFSNNESAIEFCKSLLTHDEICNYLDVPGTRLCYLRLFCPGGSRYLCDCLNFTASDQQHDHWDRMLHHADSPDVVSMYGRTWCRDEICY